MKLKSLKISLLFVSVMTLLLFASCKDDDKTTPKPKVTITELGLKNSKVAYVGTDLHVEAEIVAQGKIDKVTIEIHPEGEHADAHDEEIEMVYTEFKGLKNATFHKHIDIPANTEVGDYHFHLEVVDMEGQQTVAEAELKVKKAVDTEKPELTVKEAPAADLSFAKGEKITIKGVVKDNVALGGMFVGLVREDAKVEDAKVNPNTAITLLHTHAFDTPMSHEFMASITVGDAKDKNKPAKDLTDSDWSPGAYYLLVKCKDHVGNWVFSKHIPVKIVAKK